jgi:amidase
MAPPLVLAPTSAIVPDGVAFLPALEQAKLVRERKLSPVELVELYLERIERLDPALNAFVTVCGERAREEARRAEAEPSESPFRGVPIAIKDLTETGGVRTTYSSRVFADNVPEADSAVVRRIREAGFLVLGKTNTPEFGSIPVTESELNGACRNPWDPERTPGGSSGGAAAAVAAAMCPIAQGSDGGGSIRIPAACCGLFGLKPSRGRVSQAPYGPGTMGLSTSGPIARTVADAAGLLDVMAGYEVGDPVWAPPLERPLLEEVGAPPGRLRIAVTVEPPVAHPVDPARVAATEECARLLEELGHDVVEATPPWRDDAVALEFTRVWQTGPALWAGDKLELLEPLNRALADDALAATSVELGSAVARLQTYSRRVVAFWTDFDLVLTPALALAPVPIGWLFETDDPRAQFARALTFTPFTPVVNLTGLPAAAVPFGLDEDGLPLAVQLIAGPAADDILVRVGAQLELARPWVDARPALAS